MAYALAPTLHACITNDQVIVLDLQRNRYFRLPPLAEAAFQRASDGIELTEAERDALHRALPALESATSLHPAPFRANPMPRPAQHLVGSLSADTGFATMLNALWVRVSVESRLDRQPLGAALALINRIETKPRNDCGALLRLTGAFWRTRSLLSAPDTCVPWSVALTCFLRRHGLSVRWVIGVKTSPFAAHAWVQHQDLLLSDELDTVRPFTPILVH